MFYIDIPENVVDEKYKSMPFQSNIIEDVEEISEKFYSELGHGDLSNEYAIKSYFFSIIDSIEEMQVSLVYGSIYSDIFINNFHENPYHPDNQTYYDKKTNFFVHSALNHFFTIYDKIGHIVNLKVKIQLREEAVSFESCLKFFKVKELNTIEDAIFKLMNQIKNDLVVVKKHRNKNVHRLNPVYTRRKITSSPGQIQRQDGTTKDISFVMSELIVPHNAPAGVVDLYHKTIEDCVNVYPKLIEHINSLIHLVFEDK